MYLVPANLRAWGQEGHRIIAAIAESRLDTSAAKRVWELVGQGGLPQIANWADEIRKDRPETAPWHYVNIPREEREYDPARDCLNPRQGDCLIAAIERFQLIVADDRRPKTDHMEALKFLTHLVADLHQPLHCIKDHEGGTTFEVVFFGERSNPFSGKPWNLHAVWDVGLIERAGISEEEHIHKLNAWLDSQSSEELEKGRIGDWALESHRIAIDTAYRLPEDRRVGLAYLYEVWPTLDHQLAKAGLRLARILNDVLARSPVTLPPSESL